MQEAIEPAWWLSAISDLRWKGVEYAGSEPLKGVVFAQKYFDLYLKQATKQMIEEKNGQMLQQYLMMNGLILSPFEIINPLKIAAVLDADPSDEAKELKRMLDEVSARLKIKRLNYNYIA